MVVAEALRRTYRVRKSPPGLLGGLRGLVWPEVRTVDAVVDVSFAIGRGEFVGVVGPNGAGKGVVQSADQVTREAVARDLATHIPPDGVVVVAEEARRLAPALARHVASLMVEVDPRAQGRGHGRALMRALVAWADAGGVERLQLTVRADNARAIALYRSLGFAWESTRRGFLRLADGRPVDDLVLVRTNRPVTCEKAAAALIRDRSICLFGHPSAGWQVPKGTLEPGEDAATAVLREVEEETGLVGARILAPLGSWHVLPPDGTVQRWHGFALAPPAGCPDRWDHVARGSVEEDGLVFELRWTPLAWADEVLPPQFHELVHRARALGGRGP